LNNKDLESYNKAVSWYVQQKLQTPKMQEIMTKAIMNHSDTFKSGIHKVNNLEKEELEQ